MAQPKKRTTRSKTGTRRSHLLNKLQKMVNKTSPVKVKRKKRFLAKKEVVSKTKPVVKAQTAKSVKPAASASKAAKPAVKKATAKKPTKPKTKPKS